AALPISSAELPSLKIKLPDEDIVDSESLGAREPETMSCTAVCQLLQIQLIMPNQRLTFTQNIAQILQYLQNCLSYLTCLAQSVVQTRCALLPRSNIPRPNL